MKWLLPALLASLALAVPAGAQPAAPPAQAQTPINSYCWNGTAVVMCTTPAPLGTYLNASAALSTTSAQVLAATARVRVKLINNSGVGTTGGAAVVIWCRWGATPVAGAIGSFALPSGGGGIDDQGPGVNQSALNCLSESGTPNLYVEQY